MTNPRSPSWLWLAVAAAVLAAFGNVVGLSAVDRVYGRETAVLLPQAISQDVVGLGVVAPGMVVLAVLLLRGRARVEALLLGAWLSRSTTTPSTRSRSTSDRCSCSGPWCSASRRTP